MSILLRQSAACESLPNAKEGGNCPRYMQLALPSLAFIVDLSIEIF